MLVEVRVPTILKRSLSTDLLFVKLYGYTYVGPSLTSSKVKEEETKYAYDTYGRVTKTTYVNGIFDQVDYNDTERQITSTDKKGIQRL